MGHMENIEDCQIQVCDIGNSLSLDPQEMGAMTAELASAPVVPPELAAEDTSRHA